MKFKTTRKDIKNHYGKDVYYVRMSNPKFLLGEPQAYITRVEGWACDVWIFDRLCITEGYSPMGIAVDFDLCREYEEKARKIYKNNWTYKRKETEIKKLCDKFIKLVERNG